MVPDGWVSILLKNVGECLTGLTYSPADIRDRDGLLVLRSSNIKDGRLSFGDNVFVRRDIAGANLSREGDILVCVRNGSKKLIGKSALVEQFKIDCTHGAFMTIFRSNDNQFLYQVFQSDAFRRQVQRNLGATINSINNRDLLKFRFAYPPERERSRITKILSTWGRAIETNEKLIENSKAQKKALMQKLLTGRKRLPGFCNEWQHTQFTQAFERITSKNNEGIDNVLTISGKHGLVSQRDFFKKRIASNNLDNYTVLRRGDFAYNKSYSAGYPYGAVKPLDRYDTGVVSSLYLCFRLTDSNKYCHDYFRHYFEGGFFDREIYKIAQEGARNHGLLNVGSTDFFSTHLLVPSPEEQIAIAVAINTAEAEQENLEEQLATLRRQKRALMQQLLTGKRRVKVAA